MHKYRISFTGSRIGSGNAARKEHVTRICYAETRDAAELTAYETHEHIVGGVRAVEIVLPPTPQAAS